MSQNYSALYTAPRRRRAGAGGGRFNGVEKTNVEEYCISEGWIRVSAGRSRDRHGNPMTIKLNGVVEPYSKNTPQAGD